MKVTLLSGRLTKSTPGSVGYDLYAVHDQLILPGEWAVIGTGVRTEMDGCFALIQDRSGLAARYGVSRRAGVIDPDYRKEWGVVLHNEGWKEPYMVKAGDRIAQALILPLFDIEVLGDGVEVAGTERQSGFGSTGK